MRRLQKEANQAHHTLVAVCCIAAELSKLEDNQKLDEVRALLDLMDRMSETAHIMCA